MSPQVRVEGRASRHHGRVSDLPRHRLDALTDGVVAIAATLLVLPLVELAPDLGARPVPQLLGEHLDVLLSFAISFVVIVAFWSAHTRAVAPLPRPGAGLRALTVGWLALVAFVPFPTALIGRTPTTGSTPFYVGTLALLALVSAAIAQVAWQQGGSPSGMARRRVALAWVTVAVFAVCAVVGAFSPDLGLWLLLALVPVRLATLREARLGEASG